LSNYVKGPTDDPFHFPSPRRRLVVCSYLAGHRHSRSHADGGSDAFSMRSPTRDYPIAHYQDRKQECLKAAEATSLPKAKRRHLEAADAWQQIIDRLGNRLPPLSDVGPLGSNVRSEW
jgi:hypothetical protein